MHRNNSDNELNNKQHVYYNNKLTIYSNDIISESNKYRSNRHALLVNNIICSYMSKLFRICNFFSLGPNTTDRAAH